MQPQVSDWLRRRASTSAQWPVAHLVEAKGTTRVSVVLPARNEAATIGEIVTAIRRAMIEEAALVDELVVVDSRSCDATAELAAAAGATVVAQDDVLGHLPPMDGKGEALWKGLAATTGDVVVFVDADLHDFDPGFVAGLLGPLLSDPSVDYVKGFYHRPLVLDGVTDLDGGGRVSELVARPLLNLYWPELAGFVQPLAGEYAGRRDVLEQVRFVTGYGVELGLLVDMLDLVGLDALAQVDLGSRVHRHHDLPALSLMSAQIHLAACLRLEREGRAVHTSPPATRMTQFRRTVGSAVGGLDREVVVTEVGVGERPPLREVRASDGSFR
jgi:glucosyl-3-phosphoglycerate synthase